MARFDFLIAPITAILDARESTGATTDELAAELGRHKVQVGGALAKMGKAGSVAWHLMSNGMCHNKRRWYLPQHKPSEPPLQPATNVCVTPMPAAPKPAANGAVLVQCPAFEDRRFTFDPPPGWVGEITRDWRERRLQEMKA